MNPGYAGRSELPDNLKALFRSVAMMVPDYALIAEIMLYSSGYLKARDLARKLVATYRLCSEQLSSQSHYDYGMRAVISVLRAAAANKQRSPEVPEEVLMLRSISDVNAPKFLAPDIPLFQGILGDLFPDRPRPLRAPEPFLLKAKQLYEMILVRHGLMVVGLSFGAKTCLYKVLAAALGDLEGQGLMGEHRVQVRCLNPKAVTLGQLYGQFDPVSHEWTDGVLAKAFRDAAVDTRPDRQWLLFDGPVDAVWIENMNTVLDDNKKLCLNSGEIIQMSAQMNLIFEVADLAVASPATVSRCGMVYVEPSQLGWRPILASWLAPPAAATPVADTKPAAGAGADKAAAAAAAGDKAERAAAPPTGAGGCLPASAGEAGRARVRALAEWLVDPCIAFLRRNCSELVPTSDIGLVASLLQLLHAQLDAFRALDAPPAPAAKGAKKRQPLARPLAALNGAFVFALLWSIGGACDGPGRSKFDRFVRALIARRVDARPDREIDPSKGGFDLGPGVEVRYPPGDAGAGDAGDAATGDAAILIQIPEGCSLFDLAFDPVSAMWRPWLAPGRGGADGAEEGEAAGGGGGECEDDALAAVAAAMGPAPVPHESTPFNEIVVPTVDSARYGFLLRLLAGHGKNVLFVGPTGTGKTVYIRQGLDALAAQGGYHMISTAFSAQTSANQTQDVIDGRLDKRRRGVYGPPWGSRAVVFVDDLNMPSLEVYGAQPPLELLRQLVDHEGWWVV
ncbi:Dynein beta chain, ciliary [Monoraphidium neglectum]|uniref:Dynein beta chain, ciliary n=1 Tax=Monoraphidium neglectum TaxID=145388 RepID=A0A0D2JAN4_9CHLO|nr:Dynein beta chain, ciliary [Monoraphidium neglectum]KIY96797.1 Dynein beta chain, ciliary [Monoraphidium neglectum]|eukprot:XP_013895817.1 Dynein beta chain, ciliary [Monoraphidium neglectum]